MNAGREGSNSGYPSDSNDTAGFGRSRASMRPASAISTALRAAARLGFRSLASRNASSSDNLAGITKSCPFAWAAVANDSVKASSTRLIEHSSRHGGADERHRTNAPNRAELRDRSRLN